MDDDELVEWLQTGRAIVLGRAVKEYRERLFSKTRELGTPAGDAWWDDLRATYQPCAASSPKECLYCPWTFCYRSPRAT